MNKINIYKLLSYKSLALILLTLLMGCERKFDLGLSLSVNSNEIHLEATEGKTKIMVYSDGGWNVAVKEEADWLALDRTSGTENSDILFSYSQNFGVSRSATLVISKGKEKQEVKVIQAGLNAAFRFSKSKYTITKNPFQINLPIVNDLKSNIKNIKIDYLYDDETSEKWVTGATFLDNGLQFKALENNAGRNRTVRIYLTVVDGFDKEYTVFTDVDQSLQDPVLVPRKQVSVLTRNAKIDTVIVKGNVGALFPDFEHVITYEQGADWIERVELANDSLLMIAVRQNNSGERRHAQVQLKYTNNGVNYINLIHQVEQSADDFEYLTIDELKALIPAEAGEIKLSMPLKVLEAFVISDAGNANMDVNPNRAFNDIDYDESPKTAYVQNAEGSSGIRLKFVNKGANSLKRYSKATLSIDGLVLMKEANPTRYTIKGLTPSTIVKSEIGNAASLPMKNKAINELKDSDIYTYVSLKNTSVSVPYGSYVNVNMGYAGVFNWNQAGASTPYVDAVPTAIYDDQGGSLKAIVNVAASWSRSTLPTGSGTFSGIVVHHKLIKYGYGEGEIGRYSIRPVSQSDIKLNEGEKASTLVEWKWMNPSNLSATGTIQKEGDKILPAVGKGEMNCTVAGAPSSLGAHPIYHTDPASKVVPSSAVQYNTKWWNTTTNRGEGFVFKFSTTGISARQLLFNFSQGGGSGTTATLNVPTYWEIAYSLDGVDYTVLPNSTYGIRPLAGWGLNHMYTANGLNSFTFKLPNDLLNKPNVFVRLQAQKDICGANTADGAESGKIIASMAAVTVRLGAVAVKYIP
ncbi:Putative binding domain-containing protein, N-terminal [Sphingobacterium nematocida]|uniref:Putative binding domain-containing protein, N-terminal n=1 Tax=Sphingobacterium nematocida TaxID=1513896 RepID=A0A1T5CR27_9SPHI|nr:BACON domain-containing carbohydrate-binding protein [Sphingobacterium nematocida]SKB61781.1 Putative binding domain-containing protein, N-terminal [Sphingobacterium nematocida]